MQRQKERKKITIAFLKNKTQPLYLHNKKKQHNVY